MLEKRHDRVVEMRLCFFLGKVGDYKVSLVATRMCRSTLNNLQKIRDGEPLGGKSRAEDDFASDEEDDFLE